MQRIGNDVQYSREVGGRRYSVVERRYQIVPERSGTLTIPGARFEGQGAGGGFFDDMFNRGPRRLAANGPPSVLAVRAMPGGAPQPWLPVYGVDVRWLEAPTEGRAGEASTFVLEAELNRGSRRVLRSNGVKLKNGSALKERGTITRMGKIRKKRTAHA